MIQWHKVTWYSKWGTIVLFLVVVPVLCFYIGMQYTLLVPGSNNEPVDADRVLTSTEAADVVYGRLEAAQWQATVEPGADSLFCEDVTTQDDLVGYNFLCSALLPDGRRVSIGAFTVNKYTGKLADGF